MKFNKIALFGIMMFANAISAHSFDHLKIEELKLLVLEQEQKLEHKDKVIAHYASMVAFLKKELAHEISKLSKFHEFEKILRDLIR